MSVKHGAVTDGGLGITGALIHEKRTVVEDVNFESMDSSGQFGSGQGKSLRKKTTISVSGELLDTAALPTVGSGEGISAATIHIDRVEDRDQNEGASEFSAEGHFNEAGAGIFA